MLNDDSEDLIGESERGYVQRLTCKIGYGLAARFELVQSYFKAYISDHFLGLLFQ